MAITRLINRILPASPVSMASGVRERPERIVLGPKEGTTPSSKPPVRIFLGTEPEQQRAERVFIWSIEKVRDPSRTYEIHLMKDIIGFDRRAWLTGFTNYRFAIPHWAGRHGRAIYNDVDQIYLTDPALLFDCDMDGAGFLSINDRDTSVMLIDCERMSSIWTIEDAQVRGRKGMEGKARAVGAWGPMDGGWNARDAEYHPERSKCVHFTTIHTQPWRPFPKVYAYQHNPVAFLWDDLDRSADEAGFQVFSWAAPSMRYRSLCESLHRSAPPTTATSAWSVGAQQDLRELAEVTGAASMLDFAIGRRLDAPATLQAGERRVPVTVYDGSDPGAQPPTQRLDAVAAEGALDLVPEEDLGWVIEELFGHATRFVHASVSEREGRKGERVNRPQRDHDEGWWVEHFEHAARRHPNVHWRLRIRTADGHEVVREGGRALGGPPRVWLLGNHKPGHTSQSLGLAEALGWKYEVRELPFDALSLVTDRLLDNPLAHPSVERRRALSGPWPDLVLATGWHTAPVARWLRKASDGRTRVVQLGRKGGNVAEDFDVVVTCRHFRLPPHSHRIETVAPINKITPEKLATEGDRWRDRLFSADSGPRIVVLVGGSTRQHRIDAKVAETLGRRVAAMARKAGGTVYAVTSRRSGAKVVAALRSALGPQDVVDVWTADRKPEDNPYFGYVAGADALVVTGDSESMIAEACATGKPVYVYEIPEKAKGPIACSADWILRKAYSRPMKRRKGTVRPQQGLEYLCARAIERGYVYAPRDLAGFYRELYEGGYARPFDENRALDREGRRLLEAPEVARRVRALLGFEEAAMSRAA